MSQSQKKPGASNIADLKARLGLKKPPLAAPTNAAVPPPSGIVAPPGVAKPPPRAVPAPPGAEPPPPEIPAPTDDPFAAMNAMAAAGMAQQAAAGPEIVVVNDGGPVESVEQKSNVVRFVKPGIMILVPLVIGAVLGQLSSSANLVNQTIDDAALLQGDINQLRKGVQDIQNELLRSRDRAPQGQDFPANDKEMTAKLSEKSILPKVDPEVPFRSHLYYLEPGLVADILQFYTNVASINDLVKKHVKAAQLDSQAIADGGAKFERTKPDAKINRYLKMSRYGVVVDIPNKAEAEQGRQFGARMVEIGPPICKDRKTSTTGRCPEAPLGFGIRERTEASSGWTLTELGFPQGESVPGKKLLPLVPTKVFETMAKGAGSAVAEEAYLQRVRQLNELVQFTIDLGSDVEGRLDAEARKGKSFTFFM